MHDCWNQGTIISSFTRCRGVIPLSMAEAQSSCEKYLRKEPKALALEAEMGLGMPGDGRGLRPSGELIYINISKLRKITIVDG